MESDQVPTNNEFRVMFSDFSNQIKEMLNDQANIISVEFKKSLNRFEDNLINKEHNRFITSLHSTNDFKWLKVIFLSYFSKDIYEYF